MDQSGCEYIKCRFAARDLSQNPICLDDKEYLNKDGDSVCGMREDAIPREDCAEMPDNGRATEVNCAASHNNELAGPRQAGQAAARQR